MSAKRKKDSGQAELPVGGGLSDVLTSGRQNKNMESQLLRVFIFFIGVILTLTAVAKLPAIFPLAMTMCMEGDPILGNYQPFNMSNATLLGIAASSELVIVALICFSPWRWLPCLATALWGSLCVVLRWHVIDPSADCGCLGWLAKPGPATNFIAGLLALAMATGGWLGLWIIWRNARRS